MKINQTNSPEHLRKFIQSQVEEGGFRDESQYLLALAEAEQVRIAQKRSESAPKLTPAIRETLDERLEEVANGQVRFVEARDFICHLKQDTVG